MVSVNLDRASAGVADAFEDRELGTILATGALATVGMALTSIAAAAVPHFAGLDLTSRLGAGTFGALALVIGYLAASYGGTYGAVMAVGSMMAAASGLFGVILGPNSLRDGAGEVLMGPVKQSAGSPMRTGSNQQVVKSHAGGCTSCGGASKDEDYSYGNYGPASHFR